MKKTINGWAFVRSRLFYIMLCFMLLTQVISKIALGYMDTDSYFILAEGRDILESGIKYTNSFTVVEGLDIVVQQWLWCVLMYGIYSILGNLGLILVCIAETVIIGALLFLLGRIKKVDPSTLLILVSVFLYLFSEFISTRPNAITIILLLLQLLILEKCKCSNNKYAGVLIPLSMMVIMLLEINIHASMWIFHFLFLLPYVFPPIKNFVANFKRRRYNYVPFLVSFLPMIGTLFVNPYGLDGILYLFRAYGNELNSIGIAELQRVELTSLTGAMLVISLLFYIGFYMVRKKPIAAEIFCLFIGTFILGCICYRNYYYACIGFYMLLCEFLKGKDHYRIHNFINKQSKPVMLIAACGLAFCIWYAVDTGTHQEIDWEGEPINAADYLDKNATSDATVYTEFNNGAYMEWRGYKVYIDARPELFMKEINEREDILSEFLGVYYDLDLQMYRNFVSKYGFDYYLVEEASLMDAYLQCDENCSLVVDGEGYHMYEYSRS